MKCGCYKAEWGVGVCIVEWSVGGYNRMKCRCLHSKIEW